MILATGLRSRSACSRLALIPILAGLAAGCQSVERGAPAAAQVSGWQVVERLGEARYKTDAGGGWSPAMPPSALADGSQVVTGVGGRLIVARAGQHISAGPASRFTLPDTLSGTPLEQRAGSLRYRVTEAAPGRLLVATPFLKIEVASTVFDVTVSATATEVSVQQGRARIATPDGLRQIELGAGQSAYAGGAAQVALAFRATAGAPLAPVEPIVLPAMHPRPGVLEGRAPRSVEPPAYAGSQASSSGTAASSAAVPLAKAEIATSPQGRPAPPVLAARQPQSARADRPASSGAGASPQPAMERPASGARVMPPLSEAARTAVERQSAGQPVSEDSLQSAFDRLSEGMLDGVPAVSQPSGSAVDARRAF
jgi:hypothetical protein